jgi:O-antigen/teichoic acid export membrane protein
VRSTLLRAGAIYGVANILSAGVPFFLLPVLTRALSPADYGMVVNFFLLVTLSTSLAGLSVHGAVSVNWFKRDQIDFPRLVGTALALATASTLVCGGVLFVCARAFAIPLDLAPRFWFLAAINAGATVIVGVRAALWQSQGQALRAASLQVAAAVLNVGFSLVGVFALSLGGEGRVYGSAASAVACASAAAWLLFAAGDARWATGNADLRRLLRFGVPLIPHALASAVLVTADRFSVSSLLGREAVGIYGTAAQIGMAMTILGDALVKAGSPWMFGEMASSNARARLRVVGATYALVPVWMLIALVLWLAFEATGTWILGPRYAAAIDLSIWFLAGGAVSAIYFNIAGLFFFTSKTEWLSLATLGTAGIAIVVAPLLTRQLGLEGGGLSFLIVQLCAVLSAWLLSVWVQPMPWQRPLLALRVLRGSWKG